STAAVLAPIAAQPQPGRPPPPVAACRGPGSPGAPEEPGVGLGASLICRCCRKASPSWEDGGGEVAGEGAAAREEPPGRDRGGEDAGGELTPLEPLPRPTTLGSAGNGCHPMPASS